MVTNENGEKCSPKELANEILAKCLGRIEFWIAENSEVIEAMTERERSLLDDQLTKQSFRCFKVLGYKPDEMFATEAEAEADKLAEEETNND